MLREVITDLLTVWTYCTNEWARPILRQAALAQHKTNVEGMMPYHFAAPEHYPTDEEKKLEILKYLSNGCWLADTLHKETADTLIAHEHDHVAFFVEKNPYFDYPDAEIINEMVRDGLLSVHISAWVDGGIENRHYNLRHFRMTEHGRDYYAEHAKQNL